jgi:hypothetical protein
MGSWEGFPRKIFPGRAGNAWEGLGRKGLMQSVDKFVV